MARHSYGYLPDPKDERDFLYKRPQRVEQLPAEIDLRQYCSPVRDQGMLGSCTAFSMATGLREFMLIKNNPVPPPPPPPDPTCLEMLAPKSFLKKLFRYSLEPTVLSPLFLYYCERELEGSIPWDAGAYIRDGMKVLNQTGVCPEIDWPYNISKFTTRPSGTAYSNAVPYKISVYSRIFSLLDIKSALAIGQGVVLGFNVYESFETDEVANTGIMPMPELGEGILGGHAVFACGYKDDPAWAGGGFVIIKNSWGMDWGDKGYFYMPYAFVVSADVEDVWTASV